MLFTADEVNALIPKLTLLIARLQECGEVLRRGVREALRERGGGEGPVLLCWQYGEREVGFYHSVDGGFAGRKRLPRTRSELLQ